MSPLPFLKNGLWAIEIGDGEGAPGKEIFFFEGEGKPAVPPAPKQVVSGERQATQGSLWFGNLKCLFPYQLVDALVQGLGLPPPGQSVPYMPASGMQGHP